MRSGDVHARWAGAAGARHCNGEALVFEIDVDPGEFHDLVLELRTGSPGSGSPGSGSPGSGSPGSGSLDAARLWEATESDWHTSVPPCDDTVAPRDAQLAYAVLSGLTSSAGGMVAAATTSLPERSEAGRNYDYRYAWIRDQCFAGQAVAAHGARPELMDAAVGFVAERILTDGDRLKPAYTVVGGPVPQQRRLPLPGYPGADVVVGNHVTDQFQLDAYGEALQLFAAAARLDRLPVEAARAARVAVDAIIKHDGKPEAGIWETDNRVWTHSRLTCVASLRNAAALLAAPPEMGEWLALADSILAETTRSSLSPAGYWRRAADDDRIDTSLLIPPIRGALGADDPRTVATLAAVNDRLVDDGFVSGTGSTSPRSAPARARSCCADSSWPWRATSRACRPRRCAASSGTRSGCRKRPVHRGVRRGPAATAGQHPAGVCARGAAGDRGPADALAAGR